MPNTYTQLYVQMVFAVKGREALVIPEIREEIQKYISGIVRKRQHKILSIHCMPDHSHLFIGLNPDQSISDLMKDVKGNSSYFINQKKFLHSHFQWQQGYGAFSYSRESVDRIVRYINNQPEHHKKISFKSEYFDLLKEFEIDYNEKYCFEFYDD